MVTCPQCTRTEGKDVIKMYLVMDNGQGREERQWFESVQWYY
jgi:hypothetical protein